MPKPHIVLVIARGEAVRAFLYSDTLPALAERARVTLLSLVDHGEVIEKVRPYVHQVLPLKDYGENSAVAFLREVFHTAHYRWLWSENVKSYWGRHDARVRSKPKEFLRLWGWRLLAIPLANRPMLRLATRLDRALTWRLRPTRHFDRLFAELQPDLVFNASHIHGPQADLPMRVAHQMGIPTAVFVFSWDNLTSRSRVFVPYDHYLMWNEGMKSHFLDMYRPDIHPEQVHITGAPQFDYHFNPAFHWSREQLAAEIGLDPARPYILYTTGRDVDFRDEHRIVQALVDHLQSIPASNRPQLVVRTYIKGTSDAMKAIGAHGYPDTFFPPILWDRQWIMPLHHDLAVYTNLLRHCALGINPASTVSLELMMLDKPAINLGFEPPGSNLPYWSRFARHIDYDHYRPVAASGGVMVARSLDDLFALVHRSLANPAEQSPARLSFMRKMMSDTLDGGSGRRVAEALLEFAGFD